MSENNVSVNQQAVCADLDSAVVLKTLKSVLAVGETVSKFTASDVDDKVVKVLQDLVAQPWAGEIVTLILKLVGQGASKDEIAAAVHAKLS